MPRSTLGEGASTVAATAEFVPEVFEGERYCGSLYAEHEWYGLMALRAAGVQVNPVELNAIIGNAFDDHMTALTENMVTDEEYAEELVFGTPKVRQIVDGRVVSKTGRPVSDVVETGARHSRKLAESDPTFLHQADRDEGDLLFMQIIDDLEIGEVAHMVSMDPKTWYKTHHELCDSIGYREGMAIQHVAYRSSDNTMLMWTYAIKQSDMGAIARIYHEDFGVAIPVGTSPDLWSRHVYRGRVPEVWAGQIGARTLQRHKELTGSTIRHYSIDEFMGENGDQIKEVFDAYMPKIVDAIGTGQNAPELQSFARDILAMAGERIKGDVRRRLLYIANSAAFDDDDGRLMKVMIRYATLEKLRTKIPDYKARVDAQKSESVTTTDIHSHTEAYSYVPVTTLYGAQQYAELSRTMAHSISVGVAARRSVGGCSGISLSDSTRDMLGDDLNEPYNNMFARLEPIRDDDTDNSEYADEDEYGPLDFECTEGHKNRRERGKLLDECQTKGCKKGSVGCD